MNNRTSDGVIESRAKYRKNAILWSGVATVALLAPGLLYSFGANPPLGYTSAPGQGTCASCHGTLTSGSGVTVNAPASYTPGAGPVSMTVTIPSTGGFELAVLTQSGNAQTGALAAGPPPSGAAFPQDAVSTVGPIQYVYSTVETTSWTFSWTPPGTNVGNVVLYVTGGLHGINYSNSYILTAQSPPPLPSLELSAASLTFTTTAGGTALPQDVMVTTSNGAAVTYNATASTCSGGTWLSVSPGTGTTPGTELVSVNLAGLAVGTYPGSVTFTSSAVSNSPATLPVTLTVNSGTPPTPSNEPLRFSLVVVDRQCGGKDWVLLDGSGSMSSRGEVDGEGFFTVFTPSSSGNSTIVATGTWRVTSATSFTPVSGSDSGGVLVLRVSLKTHSGPSSTGTMTISDTGSSSGVALAIDGGAFFVPTGVGRVLLLSEEKGERREKRERDEKGEKRDREK